MDNFYNIACWLVNRRGNSLLVELRDSKDGFYGRRQDESDSRIATISESGTIDGDKEFRTFRINADCIDSLLAKLNSHTIPPVPQMTGGFDGHNFHVRIRNGESFSHFSWWLKPSAPWQPMADFWESVVALSEENPLG